MHVPVLLQPDVRRARGLHAVGADHRSGLAQLDQQMVALCVERVAIATGEPRLRQALAELDVERREAQGKHRIEIGRSPRQARAVGALDELEAAGPEGGRRGRQYAGVVHVLEPSSRAVRADPSRTRNSGGTPPERQRAAQARWTLSSPGLITPK